MKVSDETMLFRKVDDEPMTAEEVLTRVYQSIQEKGYNPINQILGYLISGDQRTLLVIIMHVLIFVA